MLLECLSTEEQIKIARGKCPDCGGTLVDGQSVEHRTSIKCQSCGQIFWIGYPYTPKRIKEL